MILEGVMESTFHKHQSMTKRYKEALTQEDRYKGINCHSNCLHLDTE